jgi:toxin ParE1/3/4
VTRKPKANLLLTQRALADFAGVLEYSTEQWGKQTAEKYLNDLEAGLERIRQQPDLLQPLPDLHPSLTFYRVNKHLFACDSQAGSIVVLTVIHGSMDIPNRLGELQPTLAAEVELLHGKLQKSQRRKS